jgi:hypothetical protein
MSHSSAHSTTAQKQDRRLGEPAAAKRVGWRATASMNAGLVPQARDLVLQLQLSTLQFGQLEFIRGWMRTSFGDFRFKRPVPQLEFGNLRRCGHLSGLLVSYEPDLEASHRERQNFDMGARRSRFGFCCATQQIGELIP